jgi:beta-galactosidase
MAKDAKGLHLERSVIYAPGELKAVATKDGQVVATDIVRTAGDPAQITLTPDRDKIVANGQDLSFVKVTILDKDGNVCPDADNLIKFGVNGSAADIAGLDDGDATDLEPFQGKQHKVYHGLGLAVLKSHYDDTGPVTLTASADGLPSASTVVTVAAP